MLLAEKSASNIAFRGTRLVRTGTGALAGGTFTVVGGAPFPRPGGAAGTWAATLAIGASCAVNIVFSPTATGPGPARTLTVAYTGATVTSSPVTLTGTGVATRATLSITPNPLTITLPSGRITGTGVVTLTNTATAGGPRSRLGMSPCPSEEHY
jgi:hypothetical protein